jgi:pimeloyl-ACP methyl ester carboxylesterase
MAKSVVCEWVTLQDGARLYTELHEPDSLHKVLPSELGPDDVDASAPTVVLLHGWTLDHRLWRRQVHDLPAGTRVLAVDLRGHGRSTCTGQADTTLAQLADDLRDVLAAKLGETGRTVLVGHSLGGMALLEYAFRHSEDFTSRTAGVVLVSTSAEGSARTSYGLNPQLARVMRTLETQCAGLLARGGAWRPHRLLMPLLSPGVRWLVFGKHADLSWLALTSSMIGSVPLCSIGGFRPSVGLHDRVDALEAFRAMPVAVLVGSQDRLTPPICAETIVAHLPDAVATVCEGAGHMLPIERPDEVTHAIAGVLSKTGPWRVKAGTVDGA